MISGWDKALHTHTHTAHTHHILIFLLFPVLQCPGSARRRRSATLLQRKAQLGESSFYSRCHLAKLEIQLNNAEVVQSFIGSATLDVVSCAPSLWLQRVTTRRSCCGAAARTACAMSPCRTPAPGAPSTSRSPGSASTPSATAAPHTGARSSTQRCPPPPPLLAPQRPPFGPACPAVHLAERE